MRSRWDSSALGRWVGVSTPGEIFLWGSMACSMPLDRLPAPRLRGIRTSRLDTPRVSQHGDAKFCRKEPARSLLFPDPCASKKFSAQGAQQAQTSAIVIAHIRPRRSHSTGPFSSGSRIQRHGGAHGRAAARAAAAKARCCCSNRHSATTSGQDTSVYTIINFVRLGHRQG